MVLEGEAAERRAGWTWLIGEPGAAFRDSCSVERSDTEVNWQWLCSFLAFSPSRFESEECRG